MGLQSGIRKKPIPDPGSRGQKGTGSRIRIRNTVRSSHLFFCRSLKYGYFSWRDSGSWGHGSRGRCSCIPTRQTSSPHSLIHKQSWNSPLACTSVGLSMPGFNLFSLPANKCCGFFGRFVHIRVVRMWPTYTENGYGSSWIQAFFSKLKILRKLQ